MKKYKYSVILLLAVMSLFSCSEDNITAYSTSGITAKRLAELAEEKPASIESMVNGLYTWLIAYNSMGAGDHGDFGITSMFLTTDLMNSDMWQYGGKYGWFYADYQLESRKTTTSVVNYIFWNYFYKQIQACNRILTNIDEDTEEEKMIHYRGQALAMRALSYFYLVQLYQHTYVGHEDAPGVPIVTEKTTEEEMANNPRAKVSEVYELILSDLNESLKNLKTFERIKKSQIDARIVIGFLARVHLTMENYPMAAQMANIARDDYEPMSGAQYNAGFKSITNSEWMWGSHLTKEDRIVQSGIVNLSSHLSSLAYGYASAGNMQKCIDVALYDQIPVTDARKKAFAYADDDDFVSVQAAPKTKVLVPNYGNLKFGRKNDSNSNDVDYVYMRAAEMYLIEAEALVEINPAAAQQVLYELVSTRDPAYQKSTNTGAELKEEIYTQRRIELWGEGFSFFDHKRLKKPIIRIYEGSKHKKDARFNFPAEDNVFRFRIPEREIENNKGINPSDNNE